MNFKGISYREKPIESDVGSIRKIVRSSGYFSAEEVEMAVELVQENLSKGESSGYHILFVEINERVVGYSCYGPIPCTRESYDLYWIAVFHEFRGRGIGRELLERTEKKIGKMGGRRIYVDTSSRDQYEPTRSFYLANGYEQEALLKDFYSPGDDKIIYVKQL
ncbi:MAG: GNAT family N-acetyltransferase [Deltaproteobacteria bacterium]|nr:GNAT family N-acetyltransferase [Deltaproteobacteria bacterium]